MQRNFGGLKQVFGMKTGGKPLEPHGRDMPIAIATRALQQIKLARGAVEECAAQFVQQRSVIASRSRKGGIKGSVVKGHGGELDRIGLKQGLSRFPLWYDVSHDRTA